jgi:hypothetical protein
MTSWNEVEDLRSEALGKSLERPPRLNEREERSDAIFGPNLKRLVGTYRS